MSQYKECVLDQQYDEFAKVLECNFRESQLSGPIFKVPVKSEAVIQKYMECFPEEHRPHYKCNKCYAFLSRVAGLVQVADDGSLIHAVFPAVLPGSIFNDLCRFMNEFIQGRSAKKLVYFDNNKTLGFDDHICGWSHLNVTWESPIHDRALWSVNGPKDQYSTQNIGQFLGNIRVLKPNVILSLSHLLESGKLDDCRTGHKHQIKWFVDMYENTTDNQNLVYRKIVTAPIGWVNYRSGVLGRMIDSLEEGKSLDDVYAEFLKSTDPVKYQRAQKEASENQIKVGAKIIEDMGLINSLYRRPAKPEELKYVWKAPENSETTTTDDPTDIPEGNPMLGLLKTKDLRTNAEINDAGTISYQKFFNHILPKALKVEVWVSGHTIPAVGFMTSTIADAKPIYRHDKEDNRYPISSWMFMDDQSIHKWTDNPNSYHEVIGIVRTPENHDKPYDWLDETFKDGLVVLKGLGFEGPSSIGLFAPALLPELHECRVAIETFSKNTECEHSRATGEAAALSIYGKTIRVTLPTGEVKYHIGNN